MDSSSSPYISYSEQKIPLKSIKYADILQRQVLYLFNLLD